MKKLSRRDAEHIMTMVGLMAVLNLADMEDFLEVMVALEESMLDLPEDSIDYLVALLHAVHGTDEP